MDIDQCSATTQAVPMDAKEPPTCIGTNATAQMERKEQSDQADK